MPFKVPDSWEWTTIGEIFQHNTGKALNMSDSKEGTLKPYLKTSNVYWNSFDFTEVKQMHFKDAELDKCTVTKGDLLVCEGGDIGRAAIWNYDYNICIQNHIHRLRASRDVCQLLYLYILMLYKWTDQIQGQGIGLQGLSSGLLDKLEVPLPPFEEQNRIVTAIEQWFKTIDNLDIDNNELKTVIQHTKTKILDLAIHGKLVPQDPNDEPAIELLKRINPKFTPCDKEHYENVPEGWCTIRVGDLAEYTNGKAFKPSDWEQIGLPIIRIQNLNDENCQYNYTSIIHEEKYRISNGDLLFAWAASLGVYIWNSNEAWLNQHIFKVEPHPFIDKQFLYYLFQYLISEFHIRSHGSGMVHITKKEFETTIALLPPLHEQHRIIMSIESYYAILDNISANL